MSRQCVNEESLRYRPVRSYNANIRIGVYPTSITSFDICTRERNDSFHETFESHPVNLSKSLDTSTIRSVPLFFCYHLCFIALRIPEFTHRLKCRLAGGLISRARRALDILHDSDGDKYGVCRFDPPPPPAEFSPSPRDELSGSWAKPESAPLGTY